MVKNVNRTETTNPWTWVPPGTADRLRLTGYPRTTIRYSNGCVYMQNSDGEWFELQVPPIPEAPEMDEPRDQY